MVFKLGGMPPVITSPGATVNTVSTDNLCPANAAYFATNHLNIAPEEGHLKILTISTCSFYADIQPHIF